MKLNKQECLEWAFGNLMENATRGRVAEFIVAKALDVADGHRHEWESSDLQFKGKAIEVKSSGYLQTWQQSKPSNIEFDIKPREVRWDPNTNKMLRLPKPQRLADIYVFCLFAETDADAANPLDTQQWHFFVAGTSTLDERLGTQKTARLSTVQAISTAVLFDGLHRAISECTKNQKGRPNA